MNAPKQHPSNRLYRGEITDFLEAMRAIEAECAFEKRGELDLPPEYRSDGTPETSLDKFAATAKKCAAEYRARIKTAELALFREWEASEDQDTKLIGEAGLNADYSVLAI